MGSPRSTVNALRWSVSVHRFWGFFAPFLANDVSFQKSLLGRAPRFSFHRINLVRSSSGTGCPINVSGSFIDVLYVLDVNAP